MRWPWSRKPARVDLLCEHSVTINTLLAINNELRADKERLEEKLITLIGFGLQEHERALLWRKKETEMDLEKRAAEPEPGEEPKDPFDEVLKYVNADEPQPLEGHLSSKVEPPVGEQ